MGIVMAIKFAATPAAQMMRVPPVAPASTMT